MDTPSAKTESSSHVSKAITFNNSNFHIDSSSSNDRTHLPPHLGPLVNDGAPYSSICAVVLSNLSSHILPGWKVALDPLRKVVANRLYWKYGTGYHASGVRYIIGSVIITISNDEGHPVSIIHLVLNGSSQWMIGRKIATRSIHLHESHKSLQLRSPDGSW